LFEYILRRLLVMVPTLFGITLMVFVVINLAPGSPVEQRLQQLRFGGAMGADVGTGMGQGELGVSQEILDALNKQYGFDKPLHQRYWIWLTNLARLDFGHSFTYEESVTRVIASKFPVSLQFGITSLILTYLVCIILGVAMAIRDGTAFDRVSSFILFVAYSVPRLCSAFC
jgi:microcin C transport system permease protein